MKKPLLLSIFLILAITVHFLGFRNTVYAQSCPVRDSGIGRYCSGGTLFETKADGNCGTLNDVPIGSCPPGGGGPACKPGTECDVGNICDCGQFCIFPNVGGIGSGCCSDTACKKGLQCINNKCALPSTTSITPTITFPPTSITPTITGEVTPTPLPSRPAITIQPPYKPPFESLLKQVFFVLPLFIFVWWLF